MAFELTARYLELASESAAERRSSRYRKNPRGSMKCMWTGTSMSELCTIDAYAFGS